MYIQSDFLCGVTAFFDFNSREGDKLTSELGFRVRFRFQRSNTVRTKHQRKQTRFKYKTSSKNNNCSTNSENKSCQYRLQRNASQHELHVNMRQVKFSSRFPAPPSKPSNSPKKTMFETADYSLELQAQNQLKIVVNYKILTR